MGIHGNGAAGERGGGGWLRLKKLSQSAAKHNTSIPNEPIY